MKWFYIWRCTHHQRLSHKYDGGRYETLRTIHIEKARYYAEKAGWI